MSYSTLIAVLTATTDPSVLDFADSALDRLSNESSRDIWAITPVEESPLDLSK